MFTIRTKILYLIVFACNVFWSYINDDYGNISYENLEVDDELEHNKSFSKVESYDTEGLFGD